MNSIVKNEFVQLPDSERREVPGAKDAGPVDGSERIELTLVTRRRAEIPEEITESPQMLTADQLAGQYGTDPADLATIRDVLTRYGLEVTEDDPASLQVRAAGPVSALSRVFGTTLRMATSPDPAGGPPVTHRYRTGSLQVPAELDGIVTAVIGLDSRPQARPYFQVKPEATISGAMTSYTPVQVGRYTNSRPGPTGPGRPWPSWNSAAVTARRT
jgi:kumamolisin